MRHRLADAEWLEQCFWPKVEKSSGCWQWTAATANYGYGVVRRDHHTIRAHRISWELVNGPVPAGLHVLHHCDNPPCVNPAHLFLGTATDNARDKMAKGRGGYEHRRLGASPTTRLNHDLVAWLREARPRGPAVTQIARALGVNRCTIQRVLSGRTWLNPQAPDKLPTE